MPEYLENYKGLEVPPTTPGDGGRAIKENFKKLADWVIYAPDSLVIVQRGATDVASATSLRAAYAKAKLLTPGGNALSATNRAAVIVPPGRYDFVLGDVDDSNHGLKVDTQFIDIVGQTGIPEDVVLTSQVATASRGTLEQTADDVHIKGITLDIDPAAYTQNDDSTDPAAYFPTTNLTDAKLTDVVMSSQDEAKGWTMRLAVTYSGEFVSCDGGDYSFGGNGTASGVFTGCVGVDNSFGGNGTASGEFINCTGGDGSFSGISNSGTGAVMRRCRSTGRPDAIKNWQGLMIDCEIEVTGTNENAVEITGVARIYKSVLIANGTGNSVYAASAKDAKLANILTNKAINGNVTNLIAATDPNVIVDPDVSL